MSSTLHVRRVIVFLYAGSHCLLHNLTDMHWKASACLGLRVAMVPESYQHMALGIEEAKAALTKVKDEYSMYYNRRREPAPVFTPGDRVWLDGSDIATNRLSSKLSHRRLGPFVVEACVGHGAYCLALPPHFRRLHPIFPMVKLSPMLPDPIPGQ
jgi:hypothetical protein